MPRDEQRLLARLQASLLFNREIAAGESAAGGEPTRGLKDAYRQRVAAEQELRQRAPRLAAFWGIAPATCHDLEQALTLHPETAVLHYFAAEERVLTFVTTVDGTRAVHAHTSKASLTRDVQRYRQLIALQGRGGLTAEIGVPHAETLLKDLEHKLYEVLIAPAEQLLPADARLCIVPHGALHYLPFAALRARDGAPLIDAREVFYAVSLSIFDWCHSQSAGNAGRDVVAFANPALAERRWDLPMAEEHARSLAARHRGIRLFAGGEATKETFWRQAPAAGVLALDLHNTFDEVRPFETALRFAPRGADDGRLTIREIYRRGRGSLPGRLAVAAVCDGNVGEKAHEGAEDELTTLARALHYAGFASVVTSLWRVHDLSAWLLMEAFYDELLAADHGDASLAAGEALRHAQAHLARLSGRDVLERAIEQRERIAAEDPRGLRRAWIELCAIAWVEAHCGNFAAAMAAYERARGAFATGGDGYERIVDAIDHDVFALGQMHRDLRAAADYERPIFAHPYYWGAFVLLGRWSC